MNEAFLIQFIWVNFKHVSPLSLTRAASDDYCAVCHGDDDDDGDLSLRDRLIRIFGDQDYRDREGHYSVD